jgi:hypothetical protein
LQAILVKPNDLVMDELEPLPIDLEEFQHVEFELV